jgi:LacI family transcriptional regulator
VPRLVDEDAAAPAHVTLKDVARAAGVAPVTASYALSSTGTISKTTAARVQKIAAEMGYRPHMGAASLRRRHTATLGVLIRTSSNPFYSELMAAIEAAAAQRGYSVLAGAINRDPRRAKRFTDYFLGNRCDGVIIISSGNTPVDIVRAGVPTVLVNAHLSGESVEVPIVEVDDRQGMGMVVKHLAELGHRRIAMVSFPTVPLRLAGFCQALESAGLNCDPDLVVYTDDMDHPFETSVVTAELLKRRPDITAVVGGNDMAAMGVLRAAYLTGRRVPDDLAVTGFDNISLGAALVPALTTIAQPIETIAAYATDLMMGQIQKGGDQGDSRYVLVGTKLIVRESCGANSGKTTDLGPGRGDTDSVVRGATQQS